MSRSVATALLAGLLIGAPPLAVCARAQAAVPFEKVELPAPRAAGHRAAYVTAGIAAALIAASFSLSEVANRRYDEYLAATDPAVIEERYDATVRADRLASASLLAGEALVATSLYLRFLRRPHGARVSVRIAPAQCAVSLRF